MFLAHFSGWSYVDLMEMEGKELHYWYFEAVKLHKEMNKSPDV